MYQLLGWFKLSIYMQCCNSKTTFYAVHIYFLAWFNYFIGFPVSYMIHRGEDNLATDQNKEWYSIYKQYFWCHKYIFMKLYEFSGDLHRVPCRVYWFLTSGLLFLRCNVFAQNYMSSVDILDNRRIVYDFLALDNPHEFLVWWIPEFGIQTFLSLCTTGFSLGGSLLVYGYCIGKYYCLIIWIVTMEPVFMHLEFHFRFFFILPAHHEYLMDYIICYSMWFNQVFESNDVGYIIFAEPHIFFISGHFWLVGNCYGYIIALYCHIISRLGNVLN